MKPAIISIFFILICVFCQAQVQGSSGNVQQDSINKAQAQLQAEATKYLDSLEGKISLKEFRAFIYESVSMKEFNELPFQQLLNFYNQQKINAWLNERAKKQTVKPPPKKN